MVSTLASVRQMPRTRGLVGQPPHRPGLDRMQARRSIPDRTDHPDRDQCKSRAGVIRTEHHPDRDGKCIFCGWVDDWEDGEC